MPENYFEPNEKKGSVPGAGSYFDPSAQQNSIPGAGTYNTPTFGNPLNPNPIAPEPSLSHQEEQKFAPPSPNVFIRTSDSDLEKMKDAGGAASNWPPSNQPVFSPSSPLEQPASPVNPIPSNPSFNEPIVNPNVMSDFTNFTQPPSSKKNNKIIPLLIIVGIIILGAVFGYLFLWPKLFGAKKNPVSTTTTTLSAVVAPITTNTTLPPSPYPQVSGPYQKTPVNITLSGSLVLSVIKNTATSSMQPAQTFSILMLKYHDYLLSGDEIINSLIPTLPDNLKPYLLGRKYLLYTYYGEVNPSLGLVIDIGQENVTDVQAAFANWEKGKILSNLSNFWLIKVPKTAARSFKEATTPGATVRYFAYSGKEAAITYGFFNNYLIISSSLESVNSAISHLQGATELIYP
ncbi:MAG: hypothetical protein ACP5RX_00810 [Minisyncoccia bacterium]